METVARNAGQALALHKTRRGSDLTSRSLALQELQDALGLDEAPLRIECYDVSHLQESDVVASMVVFEDGLARKSEYRRFVIKGRRAGRLGGDVASIHEVISRRFRRYVEERAETGEVEGATGYADEAGAEVPAGIDPETGRPKRFAYPPNLVVVDGGAPQVAAAQRALDELGVDDVALVRAGQAARGGLAARRGAPGRAAADQRGPVPAAAGARRGAPVRDHAAPQPPVQGDDRERARRRTRAGGDPAHGAAASTSAR